MDADEVRRQTRQGLDSASRSLESAWGDSARELTPIGAEILKRMDGRGETAS